jgi:DNA-binding CsgD family transcriptional regulator
VSGFESLPPAVKEQAELVLTRKQLDVLKLYLGGMSVRRISYTFGIAEPTAREHLRRATDNLAPFYEQSA